MKFFKNFKLNFHRSFGKELYLMWIVALGISVPMAFYRIDFFVAQLFVVAGAALITVIMRDKTKRNIYNTVGVISDVLDPQNRKALHSFPIPVLVVDEKGICIWNNSHFEKFVFDGESPLGRSLDDVMPQAVYDGKVSKEMSAQASYNGKCLNFYSTYGQSDGKVFYTYYFLDITYLKTIEDTYFRTRPNVIAMMVDNYEEVMENSKESEKMKIQLKLEETFDNFISDTTGFIIKTRQDKYLCFVEDQHLERMIAEKFVVIENVRKIGQELSLPITLSIGVGRGAVTLEESEVMAKQALDMALGRGGDQAAVKNDTSYEFFGGVSQTIERRTKVKSRVVAAALKEFIDVSDNVLIMGHKNPDLDAAGSAIALAIAIRKLGKESYVIEKTTQDLISPLISRLHSVGGYENIYMTEETALDFINKDTLLIITDTHSLNIIDSDEIYRSCKNIIVIDHHRKVVDYIPNTVLFYHESYASSASEMVTELIQYLGDRCQIGKYEAEALLAGIMLDTKNFVIKTGIRTFEAAAYLRKRGADTVEVRRMFANTLDSYRAKSEIVSNAEIHNGCAIAIAPDNISNGTMIVAQSADELLTIKEVDASFVLCKRDDRIIVSARSMGALNVQVIMERFGGGGHHTMAGAQIKEMTKAQLIYKIKQEIDNYKDKNQG